MFHDSRIVEQLLKWGVEEDICILSVHDSFLVKKQHDYKLLFKMHEVYEEIIGKAGKPVKRDYLGVDHLYDLKVIHQDIKKEFRNGIGIGLSMVILLPHFA